MISLLNKRRRFWTAALMVASTVVAAQNQESSRLSRGGALEPMAVDRRIAAALEQVSAERIRANIEKLVSFGTRSTISAQDSAAIGSGRGRDLFEVLAGKHRED